MSEHAAAQTHRDVAEIGWNGGVGLGGGVAKHAAATRRSDSDSDIPTHPSLELLIGGSSGLASNGSGCSGSVKRLRLADLNTHRGG